MDNWMWWLIIALVIAVVVEQVRGEDLRARVSKLEAQQKADQEVTKALHHYVNTHTDLLRTLADQATEAGPQAPKS